jgi:hypothetical protein
MPDNLQSSGSPHGIQRTTTVNPAPRILIVADFGPGVGGGGWILIKQFLRGLDWNQVYWWSLFDAPETHEFGGRHESCRISPRLSPNKTLKKARGWIFENIIVPYAATRLLAYIRKTKPDFILFVAHCWGIPIVRRVMPKVKTHWHLALHDMPGAAGAIDQLGRARTERFMRYLDDLYIKATSRAAVSPAMTDEMRKRTGAECHHFFRCAVEPEILDKLSQPRAKPADEVIRIGYAGTIVVEAVFARLVSALRTVRQRTGRKVEIHLYSWHPYKNRDWFDPEIVIEHGSRSELEIYKCYQELTWGLAIMGLDDSDPRYNRFSFPCKFTTCLAAGLPLICLGHHESTLFKLVANYQLGLSYSDLDTIPLADYLEKRLFDFSPFDLYRSEIERCARIEFNAERNRQELHELMQIQPGL